VDFFNAPHIVSEDKGASLLGVGAVVYPSVMKSSKNFEYNGKEFFVGAGSWYPTYELGPSYAERFNAFTNLIYRGIDYKFAKAYVNDGQEALDAFKMAFREYADYAQRNAVFLNSDHLDLRTVRLSHKYKPVKAYETRSFVGHIVFNEEDTRAITNNFWGIEGVHRKDNPLFSQGTTNPFGQKAGK
jgi:hypothetical protein